MACNVKKSTKRNVSVGRVQGKWSQVQSKQNLSFGSIVYHSSACLCFSGPDPAQLQSKECFVFDVNRSRSIFNLPAAVHRLCKQYKTQFDISSFPLSSSDLLLTIHNGISNPPSSWGGLICYGFGGTFLFLTGSIFTYIFKILIVPDFCSKMIQGKDPEERAEKKGDILSWFQLE